MRQFKRTLLAAGLSFVPVLFVGCDVPVDFWQEQSVKVNYAEGVTTISQEEDVDIGQNSAISGKAALIKNVQIPEVWISVDKIYEDNKATSVTGTMTITDLSEGSTFEPLTLTYEGDQAVPIAEGGKIDLTPKQADIDRLQVLIQTKGKFHVKYSGAIQGELPAHFDLTGKLHVVAAVGT